MSAIELAVRKVRKLSAAEAREWLAWLTGGSAPAPGAAADAHVRRRERASASMRRLSPLPPLCRPKAQSLKPKAQSLTFSPLPPPASA